MRAGIDERFGGAFADEKGGAMRGDSGWTSGVEEGRVACGIGASRRDDADAGFRLTDCSERLEYVKLEENGEVRELVESSSLENCRTFTGTVGSNPTLTASLFSFI